MNDESATDNFAKSDRNATLSLVLGCAVLAVALILNRGETIIAFVAIAVIFIPSEKIFSYTPMKIFRYEWKTDFMHFFVSSMVTSLGISAIGVGLAVVVRGEFFHSLQHVIALQPVPLILLESIVVVDFAGYWAHRLGHSWSVMWRFHSIHHSVTEMDWLASARFHPVDNMLLKGSGVILVTVLGFPAEVFGVYVIIKALEEFYVHSNANFHIGFVKWLIPNPEFHHWHHAVDREAWNHNYGGAPYMDLIFRTAYMPRGKEPSGYGTTEGTPSSYYGQITNPFLPRGKCKSMATPGLVPGTADVPVAPSLGSEPVT